MLSSPHVHFQLADLSQRNLERPVAGCTRELCQYKYLHVFVTHATLATCDCIVKSIPVKHQPNQMSNIISIVKSIRCQMADPDDVGGAPQAQGGE